MNFGEGQPNIPFSVTLGTVLEGSNVTGDSEATDNLHPTSKQYALKPGDFCLLAGSDAEVDQHMMIIEVLDPEKWKEDFPDYQDRLMKSFVLCRWMDYGPPSMEGIGWFSRVKLIQVTAEQYEQVKAWFDAADLPPDPPEWLNDLLEEYTSTLHELSPSEVPKLVTCGKCGSTKVELHLSHHVQYESLAGELTVDGQAKYIPMNTGEATCSSQGHLRCNSCGSTKELEKGELIIGAQSHLVKILGGHHDFS